MNRNTLHTWILTIAAVVFCGRPAGAEVKLHGLFTDGAVLQQGVTVPVWGTAKDGEQVTVTLAGQKVTATAKDGRWLARLKPLRAGGPLTMTVAGENTITITNLLVGEVWVCSGQSNMEWPLSLTDNAPTNIAAATDPQLRLLVVPHRVNDEPQRDLTATWKECTPATAGSFSAVAYFFGRDLRQARRVPVGLIKTSWGGTIAEAWTSRAALERDPVLQPLVAAYQAALKKHPADLEQFNQQKATLMEQWQKAADEAKVAGQTPPRQPQPPGDPAAGPNHPAALYNGMIAPLQPYAIRGAIWYQGESNAGRAKQYQTLFPALIRCWREEWDPSGAGSRAGSKRPGQDFPFLFVQIAPCNGMIPEIREAQLIAWQKTPRTGLAVTTDVGNAADIHPRQKEPVGARLALAARAIAYGEKLEYSGPVYQAMKINGPKAVLSFSHVGKGLVAKDGPLKGFTITGEDRKEFVAAKAEIQGNKVVVSADGVPKPTAVRFGWAQVPDVNLFNQAGLPATPFRTDPE